MRLVIRASLIACLLLGTAHAAPPPAQVEVDAYLADLAIVPASAEEVDRRCASSLGLIAKVRQGLETREGNAGIPTDFATFDALGTLVGGGNFEMSLISQTNPAKPIRAAAEACVQKISDVATAISLSRPIYDRLAAIDATGLDPKTTYILNRALTDYRRAGVDRDAATRAKVQALQQEITELGLTFARNIREMKGELVLKSADDLAGLPQDYLDAHKPGPDGLIRITTDYPDVLPIFEFANKEEVRMNMRTIFNNRAWPANEAVLKSLLARRYELAQLLGFPSYAALITEDKMVGSPERVASFLDEVNAAAKPGAEADYAELLARERQFKPDADKVEPWNVAYVERLIRKEKYEVDSALVRQYFTFDKAKAGIFALMKDLFGADIRAWNTPVWDKGVSAYELYDKGRLVGRFYLDMHPREGKYSHAAQFAVRYGIAGRSVPVGALVCNFPAEGPMDHDDVTTFLHEFGHLIHWLYSGNQVYAQQSMDKLQWDFIEAPSQLLEEWTWQYDTLKRFASNPKGEPIPQDLVRKMNAARNFGEPSEWKSQLAYAAISLNYYSRDPARTDLTDLWAQQYQRYAMYPYVPGTHPYASFGHLDGYSAIYYTYVWSEAIALDLFTRFQTAGIRDTETALQYRKLILEPGGSQDASSLIQAFLGRPFSLDALKAKLQK
jgi:thimet oligopeptidase